MLIAELYLPTWHEVVKINSQTFVAEVLQAHPYYLSLDGDEHSRADDALQVAAVAHAACGQRRRSAEGADRGAPYIVHPIHVAALAVAWSRRLGNFAATYHVFQIALLHDVLEDTKLHAADLAGLGFDAPVVNGVVTLTKPPGDGPEDIEYFEGCAQRFATWIVKAADATSNLLDFASGCVPGARNQAAKNYAAGKRAKMLPIYERLWPETIDALQRDYVLYHLLTALRRCEEAANA